MTLACISDSHFGRFLVQAWPDLSKAVFHTSCNLPPTTILQFTTSNIFHSIKVLIPNIGTNNIGLERVTVY